jgi:UDP-2-acetamido-3-amino-2,3-dideoxy-glucuronate N-acetyltransferase
MISGVAVVGCGHWGRNLVRNFSELGVLAAVVDPDVEVAVALSRRFNVPVRSFEEILADPSVDAVATASPAHLHRDIAVQAMEAGKHVFVEKPIALSLEAGLEMRAAARRTGRVLMVGHLLQYHPCYVKLRDLVRQGEIGNLLYVYSNRLSLGKVRTEENVIWSFAPHDLSMILGLAEQAPSTVFAHEAALVSDQIADTGHLHLTFPSGLRGHVFTSWLSPFKEQRFVAVGEAGSAVFDDTKPWAEKLTLTRHGVAKGPMLVKGEVISPAVQEAQPLREECLHFLHCIQTGSRPRTDADEALAVLEVLVRADASVAAERGKS